MFLPNLLVELLDVVYPTLHFRAGQQMEWILRVHIDMGKEEAWKLLWKRKVEKLLYE